MSKFSLGVLSTVMLAISPALFAQVDAVIYGGTVLTVPGKSPLKEQTLILEDGKISAIHNGYRTLAQLKLTDVPVIDLKDSYVMPGLIDMHVHLTFERDPTANPHVWLTQYDADFCFGVSSLS